MENTSAAETSNKANAVQTEAMPLMSSSSSSSTEGSASSSSRPKKRNLVTPIKKMDPNDYPMHGFYNPTNLPYSPYTPPTQCPCSRPFMYNDRSHPMHGFYNPTNLPYSPYTPPTQLPCSRPSMYNDRPPFGNYSMYPPTIDLESPMQPPIHPQWHSAWFQQNYMYPGCSMTLMNYKDTCEQTKKPQVQPDVGPSSDRTGSSESFTEAEDRLLCSAVLNVLKDPIVGINQTGEAYRKYFNENTPGKNGWSQLSLTKRRAKIQRGTTKFCGYKAEQDWKKQSDKTEQDQEAYRQRHLSIQEKLVNLIAEHEERTLMLCNKAELDEVQLEWLRVKRNRIMRRLREEEKGKGLREEEKGKGSE